MSGEAPVVFPAVWCIGVNPDGATKAPRGKAYRLSQRRLPQHRLPAHPQRSRSRS